jgi:hypothetical protein
MQSGRSDGVGRSVPRLVGLLPPAFSRRAALKAAAGKIARQW